MYNEELRNKRMMLETSKESENVSSFEIHEEYSPFKLDVMKNQK